MINHLKWLGPLLLQKLYPDIWKPDHLKSDFQRVRILNGQISDPHCNFIAKNQKNLVLYRWVDGQVDLWTAYSFQQYWSTPISRLLQVRGVARNLSSEYRTTSQYWSFKSLVLEWFRSGMVGFTDVQYSYSGSGPFEHWLTMDHPKFEYKRISSPHCLLKFFNWLMDFYSLVSLL